MSKASDRIALGFIKLSNPEKQLVLNEIKRHNEAQGAQKIVLEESLAKRAGLDLGPMDSDKCPYCGK